MEWDIHIINFGLLFKASHEVEEPYIIQINCPSVLLFVVPNWYDAM